MIKSKSDFQSEYHLQELFVVNCDNSIHIGVILSECGCQRLKWKQKCVKKSIDLFLFFIFIEIKCKQMMAEYCCFQLEFDVNKDLRRAWCSIEWNRQKGWCHGHIGHIFLLKCPPNYRRSDSRMCWAPFSIQLDQCSPSCPNQTSENNFANLSRTSTAHQNLGN